MFAVAKICEYVFDNAQHNHVCNPDTNVFVVVEQHNSDWWYIMHRVIYFFNTFKESFFYLWLAHHGQCARLCFVQ